MGKGSAPRPFSVSNEEYANRWDAIWGRDQKKGKPESCPQCGSEEYDSCKTPVGTGDPSHTYCKCTSCGHEFDGKTIWD